MQKYIKDRNGHTWGLLDAAERIMPGDRFMFAGLWVGSHTRLFDRLNEVGAETEPTVVRAGLTTAMIVSDHISQSIVGTTRVYRRGYRPQPETVKIRNSLRRIHP